MTKAHIVIALVALVSLRGAIADTTTAFKSFKFTPEQIAAVKAAITKEDAIPKAEIALGEPAFADQFPWIASLQVQDYTTGQFMHNCGGTLITPEYIVTAAHCVFGPDGSVDMPSAVYLGATSLSGTSDAKEKFAVAEVYWEPRYNHAQWETATAEHDIAIVKIDGTSTITPATLATSNPNFGDTVTAAGWGADENYAMTGTPPTELQWTTMAVSTGAPPCPQTYPGVICTAGQLAGYQYPSTCQGDSGGPHLVNGLLIGVTSAGPGSVEQCGQNPYQELTSVVYYSDFINQVLAGTAPTPIPSPIPTPYPDPVYISMDDIWDWINNAFAQMAAKAIAAKAASAAAAPAAAPTVTYAVKYHQEGPFRHRLI